MLLNDFSLPNLVNMREMLRILILLVIMTVMACQKNEPEVVFWSQEAAKMINEGVQFDYERNTITLDFYNTDNQMELFTSSSKNWIIPTITTSSDKGKLSIEVLENKKLSSREGEVFIVAGAKTIVIRIVQKGFPKVFWDEKCYYQKSDGGKVEIHVKSAGYPSAELYPADCEWAKVIKTTSCGDNEYAITIDVDKNEGMGRIASVFFKIDGKIAIQDCGPCLIQEPASFTENLIITAEEPGCLQVLMGNGIENLRRIRSLKLIGAINGLDFALLKNLFLYSEESIKQYPIDIDLSECSIVAGNKNPFEYFGWQPPQIFKDIFMYSEIPSGVFTNAVNLRHIVLPADLKTIGYSAFSGCKNLKTIDIPDYVEEINGKAFYDCMSLEGINLTSNLCLSSIGNQAFTTKSVLKELTIPLTVTNVEVEAFLGLSVSNLHLKWTFPLETRIVPQTEGCTLYVPQGTADLYRRTRNWSKFQNIKEE